VFNEPDFQLHYSQIARIAAERLNEERADYLLQVDPEEYLDYLVADAEWQTLEWDESGMTIEHSSRRFNDAMSGTLTGPIPPMRRCFV
jgi:hypothetical protein